MGNFKKDVFGEGGMLHRLRGDTYEVRESQVNLSVSCAKAVLDRTVLLAEGGTGVGKSFAYLIASVSPFIRESLKEKGYKGPIVISTSTKVLQDQLWEKDVPSILEATDQPLRVVLAKGRNNYVSVRRLGEYLEDVRDNKVEFASHEVATTAIPLLEDMLAQVETSDGEFSNFTESVPPEIRLEIESTDSDCLGEECPHYMECPYYRAKRERQSADILIVNHSLLALHLANPNVLPRECSTFIIDEAHKFFDAVSSVFEIDVTLRQVERFFKVYRTRLGKLRESVQGDSKAFAILLDYLNRFEGRRRKDIGIAETFFAEMMKAVEKCALNQRICNESSERFGYAVESPVVDGDSLKEVLSDYLASACDLACDLGISLDKEEDNPDKEIDKPTKRVRNIHKSAIEIYGRFSAILSHEDPNLWCYWSDVCAAKQKSEITSYRLSLKRTPIDISKQIQPLFDAKHAVVFTSATLQVSNSFARVQQQLGLTSDDLDKEVSQRVYPSPFPYQENVEIHLFNDVLLDRPGPYASESEKESYWQQQTALVDYYLRLRGGRALVLCSSNKLLHELYERLEPVFEDMGVAAFRQFGTDRLKETVALFKSDETSVLFGVASCWEGLDAPGSTLETVIIPQLPFAPPHPLIEARKALLDDADNWFFEISLPDMLLHLKQGAGRLVRSMTDRGVIAILSPRPLTKRYGRDIIKSLPPGRVIRNHSGALTFLK